MHRAEFSQFRDLLDRCAEAFGKPKPTDLVVQTYWRALSDVAWPTVQRCGESHLRYGKFFPKPADLRPQVEKPPAVRDAASDAAFREGERRAVEGLDALKAADPTAWREELAGRRAARILATGMRDSPEYAEAILASHRYSDWRFGA